MSETLTAKQMDALWALLSSAGQGKMPAKGADPDGLVRAGLIRAGYRGAAKTKLAELTDKGWAWAGAHLDDEAAIPTKALRSWFAQLKVFLEAQGHPLAAFFPNAPEPLQDAPITPPKVAKPKAAPKPKAPPKAKAPTQAQLKKRIEAAYLAVTGGKKDTRALLSDLRPQLADLDRPLLDAALVKLHEAGGKATLMGIDDTRTILPTINDARIDYKGEPYYLLWISR